MCGGPIIVLRIPLQDHLGVVAEHQPEYLPLLRHVLTPETMAAHFAHLVHGGVDRFEAPGLEALNFVLQDALGGGGMASRRIDPQGQAYGQMALEMMIAVPQSWNLGHLD